MNKNMKLKLKRIIYLTMLVATMILIFNFSSQNGDKSRNTSSKSMQVIANILRIPKDEQASFIKSGEPLIRKLAHFSIYAMIGVWSICLCNTYNITDKRKILICILIGFLYASSDELHQAFTPERGPGVGDIILDTIGTSFGTLFILQFILIKRKNK